MNLKPKINEYSLKPLFPNLITGTLLSISYIIYALSYITFIFKGHASPYLAFGFNLFLFSIFISMLYYTLFGAFSFVYINVSFTVIIFFTIVTKSVSEELYLSHQQSQILPTILTFFIISSIAIGLTFMILARLNLGNLFRYIPYPVAGGYSIGLGWFVIDLITKNSFSTPIHLNGILRLFTNGELYFFLFTIMFGIALYFIQIKFKKPILFYGTLFLSVLLFYAVVYVFSDGTSSTAKYLWLTDSLQSQSFFPFLVPFHLNEINFKILFHHSYELIILVLLSAINVPMTALNIEKALNKDIDINVEYMSSGKANIFFGMLGCIPATINLTATVQRFIMAGRTRSTGFIIAILCALTMSFGASLLHLIPAYVPRAVLITISLSFIIPWVKEGFNNMLAKDNLIMLMVVFVIVFFDLINGIVFGILISIVLFIFDYSETKIIRTVVTGDAIYSSTQRSPKVLQALQNYRSSILYLKLQGFLFFGTTYLLYEKIRIFSSKPDKPIRFMLLDFSLVTGVDSTVRLYLEKLYELTKKNHFVIIITDIPAPILNLFHKKQFIKSENTDILIFPTYNDGLEYCENTILGNYIPNIENQSFFETVSGYIPDKNMINQLLSYFERVELKKGEYAFHQGEKSDSLYFIESGELLVIINEGTVNEAQLYKFNQGSIIGEMGYYTDTIRTASVISKHSSVLLKLDKESLKQLELNSPELAITFNNLIITALVDRLTHANMKVNILLRK